MSVKTKKDFDYKKYYQTSSQLGATAPAVLQNVQNSASTENKPVPGPRAPPLNKFSTFETTNQKEFGTKTFTVEETYRKPPIVSNVEGLWSDTVLKNIASQVVDRPENLAMTTIVRDTIVPPQSPPKLHDVRVRHASEYYNTFQTFKETLEKQKAPVALLDKHRFMTTKLELHDRKRQPSMNKEDKQHQYRDEQVRGKGMRSTFVPERNHSNILTKDDNPSLRASRYERLSSIGAGSTISRSEFIDPHAQLPKKQTENAFNTSSVHTSQMQLLRTTTRNNGSLLSTTQELIKPIAISQNIVSNPKYRRSQILKVGIHGEPIVSDIKVPNPDEIFQKQ